ncbi:hypothetical protein EYF80_063764 [Liparis tanakae]|uniref:Uncharacterized protein n=1 Tax=Liparis tanakae TaxID=230148 RepID=A0A4Z2EBZ9_9TELE|nr:hypothetical protein EYF80_063764 [Liparis tanakae]
MKKPRRGAPPSAHSAPGGRYRVGARMKHEALVASRRRSSFGRKGGVHPAVTAGVLMSNSRFECQL